MARTRRTRSRSHETHRFFIEDTRVPAHARAPMELKHSQADTDSQFARGVWTARSLHRALTAF
eukprot:12309279-Alexandrium_andersonii.AAC.1